MESVGTYTNSTGKVAGFGEHPAGRIPHHEKLMGWSGRGGGGKKCIGGQVSLLIGIKKCRKQKNTKTGKTRHTIFERTQQKQKQ